MGRRQEIHSTDFVEGEEQVLDMMTASTEHLVRQVLEEPIMEREFKTVAMYEEFMAQGVVIKIHETTDDNAPWVVPVGVNGDMRHLPRDIPIRIPRKFVECLARSQETSYKTKKNKDPDADQALVPTARRAQCYGFSVLHDPAPQGRAWLERVTRSA